MTAETTYLLLLVLGVLGNEEREGRVDAALRQELIKFILQRDVEGLELHCAGNQSQF